MSPACISSRSCFCATRWDLASALIAEGLGVVAADFFFIPPIYAFTIDELEEVVDLVLFECEAVVTSKLGARLRLESQKSRQRQAEVDLGHPAPSGYRQCRWGSANKSA
jgi:K+-sensing histidine kinase KdpD